jgi:RimJ/RimL family protein N-acetyltransferase
VPHEGAGQVTFRPVTAADLPMLGAWMARPHWLEWWGEPETELEYIREMIEGRDDTEPFIFAVDGVDLGYIQVWRLASNRVEPWLTEAPWVMWLPDNTVGVDLSIADPEMLSRGVGTAVLQAFVARLRGLGETEIMIDPDPANPRALRAYEKAGFRVIEALRGRTGDSLVMRHDAAG